MLTASAPGAPPLAWTFSHAPAMRRFEMSNDLTFGPDLSISSCPSGLTSGRSGLHGPFAPAPLQSLHHYYGPSRPCASRYSAPRGFCRLGSSLFAASGQTAPIPNGRQYRGDRFSCSMPAPATSSRHLYTGHRQGHMQAPPRLRVIGKLVFLPITSFLLPRPTTPSTP